MEPFGGYSLVRVGIIPPAKLRKALEGNAVRLSKSELSGDRVMVVSNLNAKAIKAAQLKGKGLTTHFTAGEAAHDLSYHDRMGGSLAGGSLWSWLKNKAWPFLKNKVWPVLKPIVSEVADAAIPAAASFLGAPSAGPAARALVKETTGVGIGGKGSPEMKAKMAALRAKKKSKTSMKAGGALSAGSFRMP